MEKRDIPIQRLDQDEFGIGRYVNSLCDFIKFSDTPVTIALQGEWGSGKSSFMKIMEHCLCNDDLPEDERYESIWLNTWDLFLENDYEVAVKKLLTDLITQMENHFEKRSTVHKMESRRRIMRDYMKGISGMVLNSINLSGEHVDKMIDDLFSGNDSAKSLRSVICDFEKFISSEVEQKGNGVTDKAFLVFVDDLDRLEPKLAVTLLEALKNLFEMRKCIFIIAIDYDVIACGVEQKYGHARCGNRNIEKDFFDKLIQVPYMIPMEKYDISKMVINRLKLINFFKRSYDYTKYEKKLVDIVTFATNNNPRAIKRLMNMAQLMLAMEGDKEEKCPEFRLMEFLLVAMQLSFPKIYGMVSQQLNLDTWKDSFYVGEQKINISDNIRKQYHLDEEWKEIIYLAVREDEVLCRNYNRVVLLLEIYEDLVNRCNRVGVDVSEVFGIVNIICHTKKEYLEIRYNGEDYDKSSQTQAKQGDYLIESLDFSDFKKVLDVGCGSGATTIKMWDRNRDMHITAFDIAQSQIERAKENYENFLTGVNKDDIHGEITFSTMDALELKDENVYDLVFSNATLHWIVDARKMYTLLFNALAQQGTLAVHQGGYGTYEGLHEMARKAIDKLGLNEKYRSWTFPVFYPEKEEMERLLKDIGFEDIVVESVHSDERNNDKLVENFATASLIYYRQVNLTEEEYDLLKQTFFELCESQKVDKSSHRLYIYAKKPKESKKEE